MASKKSKVLAIAFCAAVMAGIHVNPVLAAEKLVNDGKVTIGYKDFTTTGTGYVEDAQVTITNIASQDEVKQAQQTAEDAATLAGDALSTAKGETADRKKADADLQDQIDGHTNQIDSMGKELDDLEAEVGLQGGQIADLKDDVAGQGQQIGDLETEVGLQGSQIADLKDENAAQDATLNSHEVSIKNHEAVIGVSDTDGLSSAYSGTNYISGANNMAEADVILDREISRVDGRVDRLENRIDKVGAMSAAIANLRTMGYDPAAPTEVAVGVGQYRDETGMALGLFHYPNRDFMLSLSVSTSGDEYMGGIGATWKFGRKSPEKVAEIKKAQAEADARRAEEQKLAKAEEMKKAAKEAKVQAQMERHAKLAAERAALEEA